MIMDCMRKLLIKKHACRQQSDDCHQDCIRKMTDSHQECITEGVFDGVVEFGKHRINIQKYHHIKDTKCKENDIQYLGHCSADIAYNTQIHVKDSCNCKHDKIDDSCLFEVLLKGI